MNAPGTTPTPKREEPTSEITTDTKAWIKTGSHDKPINSATFHVCVEFKINGLIVASGFSSRPFCEMPYVTTDAELRETEFWKLVVAEAHDKAMAQSASILDALRTQLVA